MSDPQKPSNLLRILLWTTQALLAASLIWAAMMKLFQPVNALAAMWPWIGQVPRSLVKVTGIIDLMAGLGLILPSLLRITPILTPVAAIGIIVLMACAIAFHITRGEASGIGANGIFALMAAFVAWGRLTKATVKPN